MRTRAQIEAEARQLELRGRELAEEWRREIADSRVAIVRPAVVFAFPESVTRFAAPSDLDAEVHRIARHIKVLPEPAGLEFSLVESELVTDASGEVVRHYEPETLVTTDEAMEALTVGYERLDEDRLREQIEPIAERMKRDAFAGPITDAAIAEVEVATADMEFMPAARMRVRADAIAMLEGRLEPGDFVARTVQRQQCYATALALSVSHAITERIDVG